MHDLLTLYRQTLARLSGEGLVRAALGGTSRRAHVFGLGKAAPSMARGVPGPAGGLVVAKRESAVPAGVQLVLGSHPFPDEQSEQAGRDLLWRASKVRADDEVLFLVSGGGSALAAVPAKDVTVAEKVEVSRALMAAGASIEELNAVRKHLSLLKGGQLLAACKARHARALVLSDIPGGDVSMVASGPVSPDASTFAEALLVLKKYGVTGPKRVVDRLARGAEGDFPETPKPGDPLFARCETTVLASPADLTRVAGELCAASGLPFERVEAPFAGTLDALLALALDRVAAARAKLPAGHRVILAISGEPTVKLPADHGAGGRMQQLALLLAQRLAGSPFAALCAGSDGQDGETPFAGALVDGGTLAAARGSGVDVGRALERFDAATAVGALGEDCGIPAFDSGTNLCDLVLVQLEGT